MLRLWLMLLAWLKVRLAIVDEDVVAYRVYNEGVNGILGKFALSVDVTGMVESA